MAYNLECHFIHFLLAKNILSATRASGIFTQDIEHLPLKSSITRKRENGLATTKQLHTIYRLADEMNIRPSVAKEMLRMMFQVDHSTKLTKEQVATFIQDLQYLKN